MVLIGLLYDAFFENMLLRFPNHLIQVQEKDLSNVCSIIFGHFYSGVNLSGLSRIDLHNLNNLCKPNMITVNCIVVFYHTMLIYIINKKLNKNK